MTLIYDAPNDDAFVSPLRISVIPQKKYPIPVDPSAIEYAIEYIQRAEFYTPLALDTTCPDDVNAYLIMNSDPKPSKDGLVGFTRTFQTVPSLRTEVGNYTFAFPAIRTDIDADGNHTTLRPAFTRRVVSRITYSYMQTLSPDTDLTIANRFQPTNALGNNVGYIDTTTTPSKATYDGYVSAGTYIQASDTIVSRWKGNIWQMINIEVKAL